MSSQLRLRPLTTEDIPFADSIRELASWNQTMADWRRFLAMQPDGCFLAEWNGEPAGTATTLVHGPHLAWVGMVLVHPRVRRRGIGRALLERCLEFLRDREVTCVKLDATPLGRPVYARLGFQDEWSFTRWEHTGWQSAGNSKARDRGLRRWNQTDLGSLWAVDLKAFGTSRQRLIALLLEVSSVGIVSAPEREDMTGYGLLRVGSRAHYLGPIVATHAMTGIAIAEQVLGLALPGPVYWDIPDINVGVAEWARARGFLPQRKLVRMYLGANASPGEPRWQFAITGPETG